MALLARGIGMTDNSDTDGRRALIEAALADAHHDLYRFLLRRLGDAHDASDVLQDFFVRVLSRYDDLKDEEKLRGWMASILRTTIADHFRLRGRQMRFESAYQADPTVVSSGVDDDIDLVICACLYKLLPTLNAEYAVILWRTDLIGEERDVIASDLGLDENAFRVKLHRARKALRRRLEETCETCPEHGFLDCECSHSKLMRARLKEVRLEEGVG